MRALAVAGLTLIGGVLIVPTTGTAADARSKEQCAAIFRQLNTSGSGHLTVNEAAGNPEIARALDDPGIWQKGYLTEEEFTPLCATGAHPTPQSPQSPQ